MSNAFTCSRQYSSSQSPSASAATPSSSGRTASPSEEDYYLKILADSCENYVEKEIALHKLNQAESHMTKMNEQMAILHQEILTLRSLLKENENTIGKLMQSIEEENPSLYQQFMWEKHQVPSISELFAGDEYINSSAVYGDLLTNPLGKPYYTRPNILRKNMPM